MYINGVFSGGGIKGIALIGAYAEIEKRGYRFKKLVGTSAGAIIAGLIAAKYKSEEIAQLLDELDLNILLDHRKSILPLRVAKWINLYWRLGLYKGDALEIWLEKVLSAKGLKTFADVGPRQLRFIASDLTNGRLIVLPDDLNKYGIDPQSFSIARAIRMSCSLPYFFEPVRLKVGRETDIIVDGGVLSNFPIWLFDEDKRECPVIGIKLSHKMSEHPKHKITNAIGLFTALFETMKDAHDARYISKKHEKDIIFIPTSGVVTTEFSLTEKKKRQLMKQGSECAAQFFETWRFNKRVI